MMLRRKLGERKFNVLAVDDTPSNLVALEAVLSEDCALTLTQSGEEAISILKSKNDFDVILLDLQMPGMDGFTTAAEIKKIRGYEAIPIILITATYKEEPFVKKGYAVGAVDYFSKPFDPDILRMKVAIYASFQQKTNILKERERQLQETEELLRAGKRLSNVLETLPVGVLISDTDGRICQTNGQVAQICNITEDSEPGSFGEVLGWWDSSGQMIKDPNGPLARALRTGETSHNEVLEIQSLGNARKKILFSASPLFALDKHILGAVVVIQDVTETKKIEEDLEERITKFVTLGVGLQNIGAADLN